LKIAEKGHVRPAHRQMQAHGEIRPSRVAKRVRSCLLRQWLRSLRPSGAVSLTFFHTQKKLFHIIRLSFPHHLAVDSMAHFFLSGILSRSNPLSLFKGSRNCSKCRPRSRKQKSALRAILRVARCAIFGVIALKAARIASRISSSLPSRLCSIRSLT